MNKINPDGVRSDVVGDITSALNDIGLMYRVFSRSKTQKSLEEKMKGDGEYGKNKKVLFKQKKSADITIGRNSEKKMDV